MARTQITVQALPINGAAAVTFVSADAANGMFFVNDGDTQVMVRNTDASTHTVTIDSVADSAGRTGDIVTTVPITTGLVVSSRLSPALFNQLGTNNCNVDFSASTGMTIAVVQAAPRR